MCIKVVAPEAYYGSQGQRKTSMCIKVVAPGEKKKQAVAPMMDQEAQPVINKLDKYLIIQVIA